MPQVEEALSSYLSQVFSEGTGLALYAFPDLPKSYAAAGQALGALHTTAIMQDYQADLLKNLDQGEVLSPEAVLEHRRATDLVLHATKQMAWAIGHSMAVMVSMESRLWLNILGIKEGEKSFPLNTPASHSGLLIDR